MKRGFTLMELLIVITIIGILAGLAFPAFMLVRRQVDGVKCGNNLQQIAAALEVYRQDHNDNFPYRLYDLVSGYAFAPKALLCPSDAAHGADPLNGRPPSIAGDPNSWQDYRCLYDNYLGLFSPTGSPCSYSFEASSWRNQQLFTHDNIQYFYRDQATLPDDGSVSWADGKLHQQKFGNLVANWSSQVDSARFGTSFPPSTIPILRCYHHFLWQNDVPAANYPNRVNNVSLEFNVFWSIPYWEIQVNPDLANVH